MAKAEKDWRVGNNPNNDGIGGRSPTLIKLSTQSSASSVLFRESVQISKGKLQPSISNTGNPAEAALNPEGAVCRLPIPGNLVSKSLVAMSSIFLQESKGNKVAIEKSFDELFGVEAFGRVDGKDKTGDANEIVGEGKANESIDDKSKKENNEKKYESKGNAVIEVFGDDVADQPGEESVIQTAVDAVPTEEPRINVNFSNKNENGNTVDCDTQGVKSYLIVADSFRSSGCGMTPTDRKQQNSTIKTQVPAPFLTINEGNGLERFKHKARRGDKKKVALDSLNLEPEGNGRVDLHSYILTASVGPPNLESRPTWSDVCRRWGINVIKERVIFYESDEDHGGSQNVANSNCGGDSVISGPPLQISEHLVVSQIWGGSSPAALVGIQEGDIIHSLYGQNNITPRLVFGTLRDSTRLEMTVKRVLHQQGDLQGSNINCTGNDARTKKVAIDSLKKTAKKKIKKRSRVNGNRIADKARKKNHDGGFMHKAVNIDSRKLLNDDTNNETKTTSLLVRQVKSLLTIDQGKANIPNTQFCMSTNVKPVSAAKSYSRKSCGIKKVDVNCASQRPDNSLQSSTNSSKGISDHTIKNLCKDARQTGSNLKIASNRCRKKTLTSVMELGSINDDIVGPIKKRPRAVSDILVENKHTKRVRKTVPCNHSIVGNLVASMCPTPNLQSVPEIKSSSIFEGTPITSSSSLASIGLIRRNRMKRLCPDSSVFRKHIMKWCPPEAVVKVTESSNCQKNKSFKVQFRGPVKQTGNLGSLRVPPCGFRDTPEMLKFMCPHILEQGWKSVNRQYEHNSAHGLWTRDTLVLSLLTCAPVDCVGKSLCPQRLYEFKFELDRTKHNPQLPERGSLFAVYSQCWDKSSSCIGMFHPTDSKASFLQDQELDNKNNSLFRLSVCVSKNKVEGTGWLAESDLPPLGPDGFLVGNQVMYALHIGTSKHVSRQYEGLKSTAYLKEHLKKAIFYRDQNLSTNAEVGISFTNVSSLSTLMGDKICERDLECPSNTYKPPSVPYSVWDQLSQVLDPPQLSVISKVMNRKSKENISLILGPPGSGKTATIVGLVTALLNDSCPIPGPKSSEVKVEVGKTFLPTTDVKTTTLVRHTPRILICAYSYSAIDDLAWRIHRSDTGSCSKVKIVRVGLSPRNCARIPEGNKQNKCTSFISGREKFLKEINLDHMLPLDGQQSNFVLSARRRMLSECQIVCTTLNDAGSKDFTEAVARECCVSSEFEAVIIDEACIASESECLIPFKFNPNLVVLAGNSLQVCHRDVTDASLFHRLLMNGWPAYTLWTQYRMHKEISCFPNCHFYGRDYFPNNEYERRPRPPWHRHPCFLPYFVWNITRKKLVIGFMINLIRLFRRLFCKSREVQIGIVALNKGHVAELRRTNFPKSRNISIEISTVDGFDGREKDVST